MGLWLRSTPRLLRLDDDHARERRRVKTCAAAAGEDDAFAIHGEPLIQS